MKLTKYMKRAFINAALNDVPQIDFSEKIQAIAQKAAVTMMPTAVRLAYKNCPDWFPLERHWFGDIGSILLPIPESKKLPKDARDEMHRLLALRRDQQRLLRELETKLRAATESCTTRKALAALLPEFEKYLPTDEPARIKNLPAVANLVADFAKAGWPKDKKKK